MCACFVFFLIGDALVVKSGGGGVGGCLVCVKVYKCESGSPRFVLLKALQLIPLLGQGRLQVQIGAIVRELQRAVIELSKRTKETTDNQ